MKELKIEYNIIDNNQWVLSPLKSNFKCGMISDEFSDQGLAFANVFSQDTLTGVSTDEDGFFMIPDRFEPEEIFNISYIGFENKTFNIKELVDCKDKDDFFSQSQRTNITLKIPEFNVPFLIIKEYITDGIDLNQNGFSTNVKPRKLGSIPGQVEPDIMKSIQFLPGVTAPSSKASDIYIRGGTPDQNLILWEDIPIYHSAHYFGMISAIDPYVVSEMNVFRGGFDASYGGRAAGVIDIRSYGLDENEEFIGIGSNMINAFVYGHQKFGEKIKNSITFSVRRSFAEAWRSPTFKTISRNNQQGLVLGDAELANVLQDVDIKNNFNFIDTHLKFSSQLSEKTRLNIAGIYADNNFIDKIEDQMLMQIQRDTMLLENKGISTHLKHDWTNKFSTEIKAIATNYNFRYNYNVQEFDEQVPRLSGLKANEIIDRQLQFASSYKLINEQSIHAGYQFTKYDILFDANENRRGKNDIKEKGKTNSNLHAIYASYKNPIQNIIGVDAGLRINYFEASRKSYLEPRIKLSYRLFESLSIHANYGKHHQFIGQVTKFRGSESGISVPIWRLSENKSIPIIEAEQFQLGVIFSKNNWLIDLQAYQKEILGLSSNSYDFDTDEDDNRSTGKSLSRGFDILLKKRFNKNINTWVSYTYSNIEMNFKQIAAKPFPSDYDQRHNLNWTAQFKHNAFQFSAGLNYGSGLPYTIIDDYEQINQPNEPLLFDIEYGKINDRYLNNLMEVNLSSQYQFLLPDAKWKGFISASITNLLNKRNVYNRSFYIDNPPMQDSERAKLDKVNLPFTFNCSLRFELGSF